MAAGAAGGAGSADGFLPKPFDPQVLKAEVDRLAATGAIDANASFGDQPDARRRLDLLGKVAMRVRARPLTRTVKLATRLG